MKTFASVLTAMFLLVPADGMAGTIIPGQVKMAATCNLQGAKTCFEWCQKTGRSRRGLQKCADNCRNKNPGCK
jgi:hypothetical protein